MPQTHRFVLARTWVDDALDRHLDIGEETHRTHNRVGLQMTRSQYREALSDADYQASLAQFEDCGYPPVTRSASRALAALLEQKPDGW